jgi:hypothetical protein
MIAIAVVAIHEGFLLVWNHNQNIINAVSLCSLLMQSEVLLTDYGFVPAAGGIILDFLTTRNIVI